jgi:adenylosuccinate synthase
MTQLDELPAAARDYVEFISAQIGAPVGLVSTGPERGQTIIVEGSALAGWLGR